MTTNQFCNAEERSQRNVRKEPRIKLLKSVIENTMCDEQACFQWIIIRPNSILISTYDVFLTDMESGLVIFH